MKRMLAVIIFIIVAAGLFGKALNSEAYSPITNDPVVRLHSAVATANGQIKYTLLLNPAMVPGDKTNPFYMLETPSGWPVKPFPGSKDGWWYFEVTTYDKELGLLYGGNHSANSWSNIVGSGTAFLYNNPPDQYLIIGFFNGALYRKGEGPVMIPGSVGDNYIRWDFDPISNVSTLHFNNNKTMTSLAAPFYFGNVTNWLAVSQVITDSSGWGHAVVNASPQVIKVTYGGDYATGSWTDVRPSQLYVPPPVDLLVIDVQRKIYRSVFVVPHVPMNNPDYQAFIKIVNLSDQSVTFDAIVMLHSGGVETIENVASLPANTSKVIADEVFGQTQSFSVKLLSTLDTGNFHAVCWYEHPYGVLTVPCFRADMTTSEYMTTRFVIPAFMRQKDGAVIGTSAFILNNWSDAQLTVVAKARYDSGGIKEVNLPSIPPLSSLVYNHSNLQGLGIDITKPFSLEIKVYGKPFDVFAITYQKIDAIEEHQIVHTYKEGGTTATDFYYY